MATSCGSGSAHTTSTTDFLGEGSCERNGGRAQRWRSFSALYGRGALWLALQGRAIDVLVKALAELVHAEQEPSRMNRSTWASVRSSISQSLMLWPWRRIDHWSHLRGEVRSLFEALNRFRAHPDYMIIYLPLFSLILRSQAGVPYAIVLVYGGFLDEIHGLAEWLPEILCHRERRNAGARIASHCCHHPFSLEIVFPSGEAGEKMPCFCS